MTTYKTKKPNGRLTRSKHQVGKFRVETYLESGESCWIGYRIIDEKGEAVLEVTEGIDPEFELAVKTGLAMVIEETSRFIASKKSEDPQDQSVEPVIPTKTGNPASEVESNLHEQPTDNDGSTRPI